MFAAGCNLKLFLHCTFVLVAHTMSTMLLLFFDCVLQCKSMTTTSMFVVFDSMIIITREWFCRHWSGCMGKGELIVT